VPLFAAAIVGALIQIAGTLVGKVLLSLGIGYVTYTGVDTGISWAKAQVVANMSGLPADALQIVGVLKVGTAISILSSALVARALLAGLTSGSFKRMVIK